MKSQLDYFMNSYNKRKNKEKIKLEETLKYKQNCEKQTMIKSFNNECNICFEIPKINRVLTPCKHLYCMNCLLNWFQVCMSCPICKRKFS